MQSITLEALFRGADPDGQIYMLRDGDCVLYVGRASAGIAYRWLDNFGGRFKLVHDGEWEPRDPIARWVAKAMPYSLAWELDCYSAREAALRYWDAYCEVFLRRAGFEYTSDINRIGLNEIERMCIEVERPCFNVSCNPNPRPLPMRLTAYSKRMREAVEVVQIPT